MKIVFGIYEILKKYIYCILILLTGILTYKCIIFSTGPAFQCHDMEVLIFPNCYYIWQAVNKGIVPFWDPYTMLGQPYMFSPLWIKIYPLLFLMIFSRFTEFFLPRYLELLVVFHLIFSGVTMYWGARKLGLTKPGAFLSGIIFQTANFNKNLIHIMVAALVLPCIPLAISFGIAFLRSKGIFLTRNNILSIIIVIASLIFIIAEGKTLTFYIYLSLGIVVMFYMFNNIRKDLNNISILIKKSFLIFICPLLLACFFLIPFFYEHKNTVRSFYIFPEIYPIDSHALWTMTFPRIGGVDLQYSLYAGVIVMLLAIIYCISKSNDSNEGFIFVILAVFWLFFSISNPFIKKLLPLLPIFNKMRYIQFGAIIYIYALSIMAGKGLEMFCGINKYKLGINRNWIFPGFLILLFLLSANSFGQIKKNLYGCSFMPFLFVLLFFICAILKSVVKGDFVRLYSPKIIIFIAVAEIIICSPLPVLIHANSKAEKYFPYIDKLSKFERYFPECSSAKDLYRLENFSEDSMINYYFGRLGTYGYCVGGTQPIEYYYLWNKDGRFGRKYEKWQIISYPDDKKETIMPISLDSKLYDLMGVKYFYLPEHEWLFVDYKKSGKGEWIEAELFNETLVSGISIYNTPDVTHRRMLKATLFLNDKEKIQIEIPDSAGWHKFHFNPVNLHKFKIIADEVSPFEIGGEGTRGVVIGEVELLDYKGSKLDIQVKNFNASSTMLVSNSDRIMDGKLDYVWESRSRIIAERTIPNENLERLREGCYINKNVLPRAFMVHKYKYVKNKDELLKELHSNEFEPKDVVLLEELVKLKKIKEPFKDYVKITKCESNEVKIRVRNNKPGILILSDMYANGWHVFVNGKKEKLLKADGLFRGVILNKGKHEVYFKYTPPLFKLGSLISLFSFFVLVILFLYYYIIS